MKKAEIFYNDYDFIKNYKNFFDNNKNFEFIELVNIPNGSLPTNLVAVYYEDHKDGKNS